MAQSIEIVARNSEVLGSDLGRFGLGLCTYSVPRSRPGECSAVYGTVYYKEPLKSFDKSRTYSLCRDIAMIAT